MYRAEVIGSMLRPSYLQEGRAAFEQGALPARDFKRLEDRAVDQVDRHAGGRGRRRRQRRRDAPLPVHGPDHRDGRGHRARRPRQRDAVEHAGGRRRVDLAGRGDLEAAQGPLDGHRGVQLRAGPRAAAAEGDGAQPARALRLLEPEALDRRLRRRRSRCSPTPPRSGARRSRSSSRWAASTSRSTRPSSPRSSTRACATGPRRSGFGAERMLTEGIDLINSMVEGISGVRLGIHLCRGNNAGMWMASGGYDYIAQALFERATAFDALLPRVRRRPLGLVRAARRRARRQAGRARARVDQDAARSRRRRSCSARIDDAARFFARDQLGLSTQCGFASIAAGNPITEADEESKLRLVADTAHAAWG